MLLRARLWLRSLFLRRRLETDMQREMAEHVDRATHRLVSRGLSLDDARNTALREFGNMTYHKEEGRRARGVSWLDALAGDSRFAIRHFLRNPGPTITMLVVLAIGMAFSTGLFSLMHAYMTQRPLGVSTTADLVRIRATEQEQSYSPRLRLQSLDELTEYQKLTSHFAGVAGYTTSGVSIEVNGDALNAVSGSATFVSPNYFDVLGVRPVIGAGFSRADSASAGSRLSAVIGYAVWERFFARNPGVLGSTLTVDGVPVTIVGVAPQRFGGLTRYNTMTVWLPIAGRRIVVPTSRASDATFAAVARLAPGTDPQRATAAAQVIAQRVTAILEQTQPVPYERRVGADVVPLLAMNADPRYDKEPYNMSIGLTLLGILVLLITCTNVSALQTGLAMMRRREIAIRLSMGASRRRIIRQLLTETTILTIFAAAAGLGLVWALQRFVVARLSDLPLELVVSGSALAFTFGLALMVGTLFGLSPALHATRITVSSALKDSGAAIAAPRVRLQRGLVVAQMTLTQPLIVGLGLMIIHLWSTFNGLGLNDSAAQLVTMRLRPTEQLQDGATPQWSAEIRALRDRLLSTPAIEAAVQDLDVTVDFNDYYAHLDAGRDTATEKPIQLSGPMIAPGYFAVMGMRVILGRDFTDSDLAPPPGRSRVTVPVIVGSDLAGDLWPGENPLGRRLQSAVEDGGPPLLIVGVVDQPSDKFRAKVDPYTIFLPPDSARAASALAMLIRTNGDARPLIPTIRRVVQEGTSRLGVADSRTVADDELEIREAYKMAATGLGTAGLLTLFLAAIGLYAVVSFAVGQRTSEIAVRMAVGAGQQQIIRKFIGEGVRLGLIGLAIGLPLSLIALRLLMDTLREVASTALIAGVAIGAGVIVLTVALAATWVPARRAAGVDPAVVLRRD